MSSDNVDKFWGEDWKAYGTVDGKFYAAPLGANVKSFVWYSPKEFKENGYTVPTTLGRAEALSDKIAANGKKPWCAGIESGDATGWPLTDWLEDAILRDAGPEVYDKWVKHEIPFNDPQIAGALDAVGDILKNDDYVNGGLGDVKSIATTALPGRRVPDPRRHLLAAPPGELLRGQLAEGHRRRGGRRRLRVLPAGQSDEFGKPLLGGGEFVTAFADRPEVQAFQTYLSTDTWANAKAKATPGGGWVSANKGLDATNLRQPDRQAVGRDPADPNAVFRFDGSDQMPGAVGADAFWKQMTAWITGQSTKDDARQHRGGLAK